MGEPSAEERRFVEALLAQAEQEVRRIRAGARERAREVLGRARKQMESLRRERVEAARRRADEELRREESRMRSEIAARELRTVARMAERATDEARRRLGELRKEESYPKSMTRFLDEILEASPSNVPMFLVVDPRDENLVRAELDRRERNDMEVERGGPFLGGLAARSREGTFEIDNTLEARLQARLPEIRLRLGNLFRGQ